MSLRVISHGGGVQTTALLVLAGEGRIDFQTFLFANVGDDSEHPGSLRYLREVAMPYAAAHGITIHELHRVNRRGDRETIRGTITREGSLSEVIPVHMAPTGRPGSRSCTGRFKIEVIGRWLREHGASSDRRAVVGVGISLDELHRANADKANEYETLAYPLLCINDPGIGRALTRTDCKRIIREGGLPLPGKSACYFCPFHRPKDWQEMARTDPALFEQAAELEDHMLARRASLGKNPVYLSGAMVPLRDAYADGGAEMLPGLEYDQHCDNGWCMT